MQDNMLSNTSKILKLEVYIHIQETTCAAVYIKTQ